MVRVATNLARAFAQVHAMGNVIGDVNHGNALVGRDGTVVLIDCDSIQFREASRIHVCDVGVPLFTPPELQGRGFRGLRRTANHDAFGLAVLIFHLLYLGRHPFAGRTDEGDLPIERAIAESRFVYGAKSGEFGVTVPPGTLALQTFGARIATLFERAFAAPGNDPRPAATEWIGALQELEHELTACADSEHHFPVRGQACCWCEIESRTGFKAFGAAPAQAGHVADDDPEVLWDAICAVPEPPHSPPVSGSRMMMSVTTRVQTFGEAQRGPKNNWHRELIVSSWFFVCLGIGLLLAGRVATPISVVAAFALAALMRWLSDWRGPPVPGHPAIDVEVQRVESAWKGSLMQWSRDCTVVDFHQLRRELEEARMKLMSLPEQRERSIQDLRKRESANRREHYLRLYRIDAAQLPGIGEDEIAALNGVGIDTAADVIREAENLRTAYVLRTQLREGSGVKLLSWALTHAEALNRAPRPALDPADLKEIEDAFAIQRENLITQLRTGPALLEAKRREILEARALWEPRIERLWAELREARERSH